MRSWRHSPKLAGPAPAPVLALLGWLCAPAACLAACLAAEDAAHVYEGLRSDLPFWGLLAFAGFVVTLKFLGWDALTSGMRTREENESRLIQEAEDLRRKAGESLSDQKGRMEALDEEIRGLLAEAERDADYTRREIRAAADRESNVAHARVQAEINRVKDQTLSRVFEALAERVISSTEGRLRGKLSTADQDRLIDASLREFSAQAV